MIDFSQYFHFLKTTDLASLAQSLERTVTAKQAALPNADIPRWCEYLETLPKEDTHCAELAVGTLYLALSDFQKGKTQPLKKMYKQY